ncbi:MAG: hypothetical protein IIT46_12305 [Lachnospiraceae bacterium]|nr:hypothetical protein [Lachnospiraceae bacterium]
MKMSLHSKKKDSNRNSNKGSITIFATLTLVLVLSLIATCIENARVSVASTSVERYLAGSIDATMTEYYRPLFEDYKLFFLDKGLDSESLEKSLLEEQMNAYLSAACETYIMANDNKFFQGIDILQPEIGNVKIGNILRATDKKGQIFMDQVLQLEKYEAAPDMIKGILQNKGKMEDKTAISDITEAESKSLDSFSDANENVMKIMEYVEGIQCKDGIQYDKNGKIKMNDTFAKQFCGKEINQKNVGVDNSLVWLSAKDSYENPKKNLKKMIKVINALIENEKEQSDTEESQEKADDNNENQKNDKNSQSHSNEDEKKSETKDEKKENKDEKKLKKTYKKSQKKIITLITNTTKKIDTSIDEISKLKPKLQDVKKKINEFKKKIETDTKNVTKEEKEYFKESLSQMNANYTSMSNMTKMEAKLIENKQFLENIKKEIDKSLEDGEEKLNLRLEELETVLQQLNNYDISTLKFSYGHLKEKEDVPNPMSIKEKLNSSILELVVNDTSKISKKSLSCADYYYKNYGKKSEDEEGKITQVLDDFNVTDLFSNCKSIMTGDASLAKDGLNTALYQNYLKEYFSCYTTEQKKFKKTLLDYEQEYVLGGEKSDKKNLEKMVDKLLLIRVPINFSYILTDTEKRNTAYATALALVGFTGLEVVVRATQMLILTTWAYEESLVDVAAVMQGYKIPLIKTKDTFQLKYSDIITISKKKIQEKATLLGKKTKIGGMGYDEYLQLLLLLEKQEKKIFRTMDLVEENVRLRHSSLFSLEHCIYSLELSCDYSIPAKFVALSFLSEWDYSDKKWNFTTKQGYAY